MQQFEKSFYFIIQSTSDTRDPAGPAQLIPYIRISLITDRRKVRSDILKNQVLNAQNTLLETFHTFSSRRKARPQESSRRKRALRKAREIEIRTRAFGYFAHHQNEKLIPYNRLKLLENYDWEI